MDNSIDSLCGNLGSLLKVSINTDSVNDLLSFFYDEISRHTKEIAYINKRLDGILNNGSAQKLQDTLDDLKNTMESQMKDFSYQLKELKSQQEDTMQSYKAMVDENYKKMQEQMNQKITDLQEKVRPLEQLEEKISKVANEFDELHEQLGEETIASKLQQSNDIIKALQQQLEELQNNVSQEKEESSQKINDIIQSLTNAGLLDENGNPIEISESQRFIPKSACKSENDTNSNSNKRSNNIGDEYNELQRKPAIKDNGTLLERRGSDKPVLHIKIGNDSEEEELTEMQKMRKLLEQQEREINNLKQVHFDFSQLDGMTPMDMLQEIRSLEARLSANESEVDRVASAAYDIAQQFEGTSVGAKGCRCLACGRPKPVVPSSTIHLVKHLQEVSTGQQPPLSARPGARVSTFIGEPSKSALYTSGISSARLTARDTNPKPSTPRSGRSAPMSRTMSFSNSGK